MNDHTHTDKTLQGNNKIESAIASQDKDTILSAISSGSYDGDEDY